MNINQGLNKKQAVALSCNPEHLIADNVVVFYAGEVVEYGDVKSIFDTPKHPYTRGILKSIPCLTDERGTKLYPIEGSIPDLLHRSDGCPFHPRCRFTRDICKTNHPPLEEVSNGAKVRCWMFNEKTKAGFVPAGETFGMVDESGRGKTTTGRLSINLLDPTTGSVIFDGQLISGLSKRKRHPLRREMQLAGLEPESMLRYPHQFSGGQRQRIGVTRAIALNSKLIVCDEPVSTLDVSIQPLHPYTEALLSAGPVPDTSAVTPGIFAG